MVVVCKQDLDKVDGNSPFIRCSVLDGLPDDVVAVIAYRVHLTRENEDVFVYFFKPGNELHNGDRLMSIDGHDVTRMKHEEVRSMMLEKASPLTCEIVWHPELYIQLETARRRTDDAVLHGSIDPKAFLDVAAHEQIERTLCYHLTYLPTRPYDLFEELARQDREPPVNSNEESSLLAQRRLSMLSNQSSPEGGSTETMRNLLEVNNFLSRIGAGLNHDEIYWIWLSMKTLVAEKAHIQQLRFWGKIFALHHDYYILEADFQSFDEIEQEDFEFVKYQSETFTEEEVDPPANGKLPAESVGEGVNHKIFYVSTGVDQPFVQLPLVTPEQIESSRRLQQLFTGDLDARVMLESRFPGVEKHLLRAQIQRISAATQVAPKNYFRISSQNESEEEEEGDETDGSSSDIRVNKAFEGNAIADLARSQGQHWVHCFPYLHPQGRQVYYHDEDGDQPMKQNAFVPRILASINDDTAVDEMHSAWSVRVAAALIAEHAVVCVRSNRWPGAFAVGDRRRFENVYIGWGVKNAIETGQATMLDVLPESECAVQNDEGNDPTVEEEDERLRSAFLLSPDENEEFEDQLD